LIWWAIHSAPETENEAIQAALKTGEPAKERRSLVVVHVMKVAMICEIDRIEANPHFVAAPTLCERQMQVEIPIGLRVE
jgi:hypothetical protein